MACPNCGEEFQGDRCPNCGRPVRSTFNAILAVVISVFLILPLALMGACGALVGISGAFAPREINGFWLIGVLVGIVAFAAAFGLGMLVKNLWK